MSLRKQIFISDLDGTLLQADATISEYTREKIHEILGKGIHFTVATARSLTSTKEILGDIPFQLPVICSNGGTIFKYDTEENLHAEYMPSSLASEIIQDMKKRKESAFISGLIEGNEKIFYETLDNFAMDWFYNDRLMAGDHRLTKVEDIRHFSEHPITSITFMNRSHHLEKKRKFYLKQYPSNMKLNYFENKYSLGWYWLSLHSNESCKAKGIQKLKTLMGLEGAHITVFGDEMNDISMFEIADKAVAVENALPEVKSKAHKIIGHNHENAVVDYILSLPTL